jgi:hypothetical protein
MPGPSAAPSAIWGGRGGQRAGGTRHGGSHRLGLELGPPRWWWWRRGGERGRQWRWWWWTFLGVKEWLADGTQIMAFGSFKLILETENKLAFGTIDE